MLIKNKKNYNNISKAQKKYSNLFNCGISINFSYRNNLCLAVSNKTTDLNTVTLSPSAINFTNINIYEDIKYIGKGSFSYFTNLSLVTFPNSLLEIGYHSFDCRGCLELNSIVISTSVTTIGQSAFNFCNLTYTSQENPLIIPASVTSIEFNAFMSDNNTNNSSLNYIRPLAGDIYMGILGIILHTQL